VLLDSYDDELVDPRLKASEYDPFEMHCMMHAARQCIKRDPSMRPRMTQVSFVLASSKAAEVVMSSRISSECYSTDLVPV
jgi:hypothetical protein